MAQTIASLLIKIGIQTKEVSKGFNQVEGKMKNLQGSFKKTAKSIGLIFGGREIIHGTKSVVKASNDFQLELAKLNNVANLSVKDLNDVGNAAQQLAGQFGVSSNDIVHGLTELRKLGYEAADSLKEMPNILKFNVAAGAEFDTTITLLETTMNDFGKSLKDTKQITDTFTKALGSVNNLTAKDLADAFKKSGSTAKNAGASISDLSAATALLAKKGFSGAEAGTALNAIFGNLTKTGSKAYKAIKELGISMTTSTGEMRPFSEVATDIQKKMSGMTSEQKNFFAQQIADREHMTKFLDIMSGAPGSFAEYSSSLNKSSGSTEKAFKGIDNAAAQSMKKLETSFETFQQKLGKGISPAIKSISDALAGLLNWFNQLDPKTQTFIASIGAVVTGFIALGAAIAVLNFSFGTISTAIEVIKLAFIALRASTLVTSIQMGLMSAANTAYAIGSALATAATWLANAAFTALGAVLAFITSPIGIVIATLALLTAGIIYLWNNNEGFRDAVKAIWNGIKAFFTGIPGFFMKIWNAVVNATSRAWNSIKSSVSNIWTSIKKTFADMITGAVKWGKDMFTKFGDGIVAGFKYVKDKVTDAANWIRSKLHFSTPDSGPLADADTWMPDFMKLLASGIEMGLPKLQMAVGDVVATLASSESTGVGSSVTNNVNVYPRQATLDARGLNRELERMRFLNGGTF